MVGVLGVFAAMLPMHGEQCMMAEKDCLKNDSRLGVVGQNTRAPQPSSHGHSSNMRRAQTELASPSHVCRPAVNVSGESWLHL
eukprot:scaffold76208_cov35-Tisochrysis_lutea.AAC.1